MKKGKIEKAVLVVFMLLAMIQFTGCESYEAGAALLNDAVDAIKKVAGLSDGIADNQQAPGEDGITVTISGDDDVATIEIEDKEHENPENKGTEDITEEVDETNNTAEESNIVADTSKFESVVQDPDAE